MLDVTSRGTMLYGTVLVLLLCRLWSRIMSTSFPLDTDALLRVLNYLNLGIYITDRDRRIVLWNRKAEEITGHRADDVVGRACHDGVLEHNDQDGHRLCTTDLCPLDRTMRLNTGSDEPILIYARKADGSRVALSTTTAPLHDDGGRVIGGIEAFRDETSRVRDLESARKIQRHLLPQALPEAGPIRFDVRYYPHDLVGGDFYDIRPVGPGRYGVMVADVMGHGVSAALYTMFMRSLGDRFADRAGDPAAYLGAVNRELAELTVDDSFATAFYGVVDTKHCELDYTSAGHPAPIHLSGDGKQTAKLDTQGLPLGVDEDETYEVDRVALEPGDLLVGYSDGVTEAVTTDGEMLGEEGLADLIAQEAARGRANLLERVYRRALGASADVAFSDDVLLLAVMRDA